MVKYIISENEISNSDFQEQTNSLNELNFKTMTFPSESDAKDYLNDMVTENKAFSIKFLGTTENFYKSEKYEELNTKIQKMKIEMLEFPLNLINRLNEQKSSSKGCSNCKSSINKEIHGNTILKNYNQCNDSNDIGFLINNSEELTRKIEENFKFLNCPICDSKEFILNETDNEKFSKISERIEDTIKKIEEEKIKYDNKSEKKTLTMIGYIN
jgi:hypothetical protein